MGLLPTMCAETDVIHLYNISISYTCMSSCCCCIRRWFHLQYKHVDCAITFEVNHNFHVPYCNIHPSPTPCPPRIEWGVGDGYWDRGHQCYDSLRMVWHSQHACMGRPNVTHIRLYIFATCVDVTSCARGFFWSAPSSSSHIFAPAYSPSWQCWRHCLH